MTVLLGDALWLCKPDGLGINWFSRWMLISKFGQSSCLSCVVCMVVKNLEGETFELTVLSFERCHRKSKSELFCCGKSVPMAAWVAATSCSVSAIQLFCFVTG